MITIHINDQTLQTSEHSNLNDVLAHYAPDQADQPFAIAVNGEFISRTQYSSTTLQNQDHIDIVSPVGGG